MFKKICEIYEGIGFFMFVIGAAAVDSNYKATIALMTAGAAMMIGFLKLEDMYYTDPGEGRKRVKHKNAKRPTRDQKKAIEAAGLEWEKYLVAGQDNITMTLVHKETKDRKVILC